MSPDWKWKSLLLLLVSALHLWLGWKLAHFRPARMQINASHPRTQAPSAELLMVLTFETRADARNSARPRQSPSNRSQRRRDDSRAALSGVAASASGAAAPGPPAQAPLVLSLPPAPRPSFARADVFRHASALEYRGTRFDQAWISQGTLTDVVARKSKIAAMLLGAMGALTKPCTEKQRSDYDSACVPDQYRHPDFGE